MKILEKLFPLEYSPFIRCYPFIPYEMLYDLPRKARLGRIGYIFWLLVSVGIVTPFVFMAITHSAWWWIGTFLTGLVALVLATYAYMARIRDLAYSYKHFQMLHWFGRAVLIFSLGSLWIPWVLIFCFIPGTAGDNLYGPNPGTSIRFWCAPKSAGNEHRVRWKPLSLIAKLKNGWKNYPQ